MGKGLQLYDELIQITDSVRIGMEESGADTVDTQLDYLNDMVDVAIDTKNRRLLTQLSIMMEFMFDEMIEEGWTAS